MATSDAPLNVPNVTLAVARLAPLPAFSGSLLFKDNFSDYETDPGAWENIQMDKVTGSPNYDRLLAKGIRCSNSIRCTPRRISDIAGPGSLGYIAESVSQITHPKIGAAPDDTVLRFRMNAVVYNSRQSYAEFDWELVDGYWYPAGEGTDELWIQYDIYVPENYHLRDDSFGAGNTGYDTEHKVEVLYCDGYSGVHPTLIIGGGPNTVEFGMPQASTMYVNYAMGGALNEEGRYNGRQLGEVLPIIYGDKDPGYWQRRTVHMKLPSAQDSFDGILEYYIQRRVGESDTYTDMILQEYTIPGFAMYEDAYRRITGGYLMGTYNTGYDEDVNYLIDNFIVSDDPTQLADFSVSQPATPQHRRTYTGPYSQGEIANVRRPGGMVDGDTIVMIIQGSANVIIPDLTHIDGDGAGFTEIYNTRDWDSSIRDNICAVYVKKVADVSAEPYWYTVDFTGLNGRFSVLCLTLSGRGDVVNNSLVQETIPPESPSQTNPISIDLAGVTAREGDDLIWIGIAVLDSATSDGLVQDSVTFPVGMDPQNKTLGSWSSGGVAVQRNVSAGDTGTLSGTFNLINNTTATGVPRGLVIALPKEAV